MLRLILSFVAGSLLAVAFTISASTVEWKQFRSSEGFSVSYPGTWFTIGSSPDRLQILSAQYGAEGVVIKQNEAEIVALEAPESATLAEVIAQYKTGATVLRQRSLPVVRGAESSCTDLRELIVKEPAVPREDSPISVPHLINTQFFCQARDHKIVIMLRNWQGDAKQLSYQKVALRMAKSIRVK